MITQIKLANFRVFQEQVTLRIRPITLLIGQNATGKSTIIDFLQLLHQSGWPTGKIMALDPEGTLVNLGDKSAISNTSSPDKTIRFNLEAHNHNFHSPRMLPTADGYYDPSQEGSSVITHFQLDNADATHTVHRFHTGTKPVRTFYDLMPLEQEILHAFRQPLADIKRLDTARPPTPGQIQHLHCAARSQPVNYSFFTNHLHALTGMDDIRLVPERGSLQVLGPGNPPETTWDLLPSSLSTAIAVTLQAANMPPFTTLAVHHPEAFLDPLAQLELGTLVADLWRDKFVFSIIETQSDYLMVRLRRLLANGRLKPHDVSIAYFDRSEDSLGPTVTNIDVQEDGTLSPGLPMDFFGSNIVDAIKMGVGK